MQMQTLRCILKKHAPKLCSQFTQESPYVNSMHAPSNTPMIALLCFHLINCKRLLRAAWIPQWYFGTYATRSFKYWNIWNVKQSFKILKPEVLKAMRFTRWNETVFQNFCDTYWLSKIFFKNMSVLTHFEVLFRMLQERHSLFSPLLVSNIIEAGPIVYHYLGAPLSDNIQCPNYIILRNSHSNAFYEKRILEISSKILQK